MPMKPLFYAPAVVLEDLQKFKFVYGNNWFEPLKPLFPTFESPKIVTLHGVDFLASVYFLITFREDIFEQFASTSNILLIDIENPILKIVKEI